MTSDTAPTAPSQEPQAPPRALSKANTALFFKALNALFVALLPLVVTWVIVLGHWPVGGFLDRLSRISLVAIRIGTYDVSASYIVLIGAVVLGILGGLSMIEYYFFTPIRSLRTWLLSARSTSFVRMPLFPHFDSDEIGDLARLTSATVASLSKVTDSNKSLSGEKSIFISVAAHQLRTPLTGLLWGIEEMLKPDTTEESKKQLLTDIQSLLKRMRLITNHILASASVEEGKFGYVFEKVDIVPIIEKLVEEFQPVSEDRGVMIEVKPEGELFPVYVDAERIALSLFDLISNAIDYTPRGGTITISIAPLENHNQLSISVIDTGIGISEAEIPFLFNKFYRGSRARHMRPDGSGLGLFLVKNIITSHGSDISVSSREGVGSRFTFNLNTQKPNDV